MWVMESSIFCRIESITNLSLNAGDIIDAGSLPLLSIIKVISLFGVICLELYEIRETYVKIVIKIAYAYEMIIMAR